MTIGSTMTIGKRISFGFMIILVLLMIMVIINTTGVNSIVSNADEVISGNTLDGLLAQKEVDHLNWVGKVSALVNDEKSTELTVETDHTKCGFGKWLYGDGRKKAEDMVPSLAPLLKNIEQPHKDLHDSAIAIKEVFVQADTKLPAKLVGIQAAHLAWASKVRDAIITKSATLEVETDPTKCGLGQWLESEQAKIAYRNGTPKFKELFDSIREGHSAMHTSATQMKALMADQQFDGAIAVFQKDTLPRLNTTIETLKGMVSEAESRIAGKEKAAQIYTEKTTTAVSAVQDLLAKIRKEAKSKIMTDEVMISAAVKTRSMAITFGLVIFVVGIIFAAFLSRSISATLSKLANQMSDGSQHVDSAAKQILASSLRLADGASSQAAAVEQISATMEEITAMTRQDADNASQSERLIKEATNDLSIADESMQKLTASMQEISTASTETNKIVKTIDEIAFQTNLLALNAAVEAARAGEAGAGFAVVANEVRSLAMRATEAAKNTSDLIEGTVQKIKVGSTLVSETNEAFTAVSQSIGKINTAVSEIAGSSKEQSIAIAQVNSAITQVDSVTQQNAATAEETASASQELGIQVKDMRQVVDDLMTLVGTSAKAAQPVAVATPPPLAPTTPAKKTQPAAAAAPKLALPAKPAPAAKQQTASPAAVLPLDDQEFDDF